MPDFTVSFDSVQRYLYGLGNLGPEFYRAPRTISIELTYGGESVEVFMDTGSIYILGFRGQGGQVYCFNDAIGALGGAQPLAISGSHADLGTAGHTFNWAAISGYLRALRGYNGGALGIRTELSFVVVAVSEAVRFLPVKRGIMAMLENYGLYVPHSDLNAFMRQWQHLSQIGARGVVLPHKDFR